MSDDEVRVAQSRMVAGDDSAIAELTTHYSRTTVSRYTSLDDWMCHRESVWHKLGDWDKYPKGVCNKRKN